MSRPCVRLAPLVLLASICACGEGGSYAVRTTSLRAAPRAGPVAIYVAREPAGARELEVVEAHGDGGHGDVRELFPELVRRAQALGADALVVDTMAARFDLVTTPPSQVELLSCGPGPCHWRTPPSEVEVMTVVLRGRAFLLPPGEVVP